MILGINKFFILTYISVLGFVATVVFGNIAFAQDCIDPNDPRCNSGSTYTPTIVGGGGDTGDAGTGGGDTGDNNRGGGDSGNSKNIILFDPINKSIEEIFIAILDIIMVFAIPIILFFIVWAGFLYVTARGDTTKVQQATTALTYAVIGALLVLGAKVLLAVITNTISVFK